jgi:phosphoribosylformylglycinamidine cyclo-ligase
VARVIGADLDAVFDSSAWVRPRIFTEIQRAGTVTDEEMARVFNLGIGMVIALPEASLQAAVALLGGAGHDPVVIGRLEKGSKRVLIL